MAGHNYDNFNFKKTFWSPTFSQKNSALQGLITCVSWTFWGLVEQMGANGAIYILRAYRTIDMLGANGTIEMLGAN